MDQQKLRNSLQALSSDERTALVTVFSLFHNYTGYSEIHDYDLYLSIPHFDDFEYIHAVMAALKAKGLVEVIEDKDIGMHSITRILCITTLNEEELHVFGTIIGFMHAFEKAVDFRNIVGNVLVSEEKLPGYLLSLAECGFITMDHNYTVSETFSGAIFDEVKYQEQENLHPPILHRKGRR